MTTFTWRLGKIGMMKKYKIEKREISYRLYPRLEELEETHQQLLLRAWKETQNAYAPYSNFKVGAALQLADGNIVCGSNQENASFPAGLCAERVALFTAMGSFPKKTVKTIAVSATNLQNNITKPVSPCGFCAQVMVDLESRQQHPIEIILGNPNSEIAVLKSAGQILPFAFDGTLL